MACKGKKAICKTAAADTLEAPILVPPTSPRHLQPFRGQSICYNDGCDVPGAQWRPSGCPARQASHRSVAQGPSCRADKPAPVQSPCASMQGSGSSSDAAGGGRGGLAGGGRRRRQQAGSGTRCCWPGDQPGSEEGGAAVCHPRVSLDHGEDGKGVRHRPLPGRVGVLVDGSCSVAVLLLHGRQLE